MTDHPILFRGEMVRAILEGRKTMTGRVMAVQPPNDGGNYQAFRVLDGYKSDIGKIRWINKDCLAAHINAPYFSLPWENGDRLWVRETWWINENEDTVLYKANVPFPKPWTPAYEFKWRPSIFMPRWASRITLEVTDIKVERLQDITEEDAAKEGINQHPYEYADSTYYDERPEIAGLEANIAAFAGLWDSINGGKPGKAWNDNPWVWVIEFKEVK